MRLPALGEGGQKAPEIGVRFSVKQVCSLFPALSSLSLGLLASLLTGRGTVACPCESAYSLSGKGREGTSWGVTCVLLYDGLQFGLGPVIRWSDLFQLGAQSGWRPQLNPQVQGHTRGPKEGCRPGP